jgi:hypothetical protein
MLLVAGLPESVRVDSERGIPVSMEEPPGWRILQDRARRETDPKKLARIIDEMNELLTQCERAAASCQTKRKPLDSGNASSQK